jgi:hypothetical protein
MARFERLQRAVVYLPATLCGKYLKPFIENARIIKEPIPPENNETCRTG